MKTSVYNRILNKLYENLNFFLSFIRLKIYYQNQIDAIIF